VVAPPGLPVERVAGLRRAFDLAMVDPEFRAEAAKTHIEIEPRSGARLDELIALIYRTPPAVIEETKTMLAQQGIQLQ
jgi:tripartite-type tricarboxylate transporter receptor subunit TctC